MAQEHISEGQPIISMDSIAWESIASSKPFRFLVGPKKREFTIHAALVAKQSPALDKLVNDTNFTEARDGYAELDAVDEQTFIRFVEYAYTGTYDWVEDLSVPEGDVPRSLLVARSKRKKKKFSSLSGDELKCELAEEAPSGMKDLRKELLMQKFKTATWLLDLWNLRPTNSQLPADAFLRHARLCVFADCYGIVDLMQLALHTLGTALVATQLTSENLERIVELLRYCYETPAPDSLKQPLTLYTAYHAGKLWNLESFRNLLEAYSELPAAIVGCLVGRLD